MGKKHVSCWARGIKRGGKTLKSWQTFKFAQMFCSNYEQEGHGYTKSLPRGDAVRDWRGM